MTRCGSICLAAVLAVVIHTEVEAQEVRRQLDSHVHGAGKLAIAIEAANLGMELEAPASDIVGFEHAPSTAGQRKAVADAKAKLAKGSELFQLASEAGCQLASAEVEAVGALAGKDAKGHAHDHKGHTHGKSSGKTSADEHSEFKVAYTFTCKNPERLTGIGFPYFKAFPKAETLAVTVIGPKGQTSGTATPAKPSVSIAGAN